MFLLAKEASCLSHCKWICYLEKLLGRRKQALLLVQNQLGKGPFYSCAGQSLAPRSPGFSSQGTLAAWCWVSLWESSCRHCRAAQGCSGAALTITVVPLQPWARCSSID